MFYYFSSYFLMVYGCMCWQGDQGYNACAITPHASQMSGVIQRLRIQLQSLLMMLLPLAAVMGAPDRPRHAWWQSHLPHSPYGRLSPASHLSPRERSISSVAHQQPSRRCC